MFENMGEKAVIEDQLLEDVLLLFFFWGGGGGSLCVEMGFYLDISWE